MRIRSSGPSSPLSVVHMQQETPVIAYLALADKGWFNEEGDIKMEGS